VCSIITDNGTNVGISNTTPAEKLHINGNLRIQNSILNTGSDNLQIMNGVRSDDNSYEWTGWYSGSTRQGIILYDGAWGGANSLNNEFSLTAENGNLLTLNTTGNHVAIMPKTFNVGVGTTSPTFKLHVPSGYIGTDYINTTDNLVGSGVTGVMIKQGDNYHRTGNAAAVKAFLNGNTNGWIENQFSGPQASANHWISGSSRATEVYATSWFRNDNVGTGLYNQATGTGIYSPGAGVMAIYNNGNLGVGITAPTSKLHVQADSDNIPVIFGKNTNTSAGTSSYGVRGECGATGWGSAGVIGISTNLGQNEIGTAGDYGLWGAGVFGLGWNSAYTNMPSTRDFGVFGTATFFDGTGVGAYDGSQSGASQALYAWGRTVATGTKSASVPTSQGNQLVYCMESPEIWFEEIGSATLTNGQARINLDPMYLETVFIDEEHPMEVFIQEQGETEGLYVIIDHDGFTVKEKKGGRSNVRFSFRVMAKRRFYQDHRFGVDGMQPFEDNLTKAKYVPPTTTDMNEMKRLVDKAKIDKENSAKVSGAK
jgi:hypothetical protein